MRLLPDNWVRHIWNLSRIEIEPREFESYSFSLKNDNTEEIISVVIAAYASDPIWNEQIKAIERRMNDRIAETLGRDDCLYIVILFNDQIVGVSGIAKQHWTDQNLLTGICIAPEHQRRGLGTELLARSLLALKKMNLVEAQVYTETGSLADEKIYPLFNSRREENVHYPGTEERRT